MDGKQMAKRNPEDSNDGYEWNAVFTLGRLKRGYPPEDR